MTQASPAVVVRAELRSGPRGKRLNCAAADEVDICHRGASTGAKIYRPEIDGLRALAVTLVLLYHARFRIGPTDLFTGGFIGVDIFFVISGYLVGRIVIEEISDHRFSFVAFYERRARRILPALYCMLLFTLPAAWRLMLPQDMARYGQGLVASVASLSNIYFWRGGGYDTADILTNPLIHTWSLGLEEQFYMILPPVLLVLHRAVPVRAWIMVGGACAVSTLLAERVTAEWPAASFFLLPTRFWELGAGILLAMRGQDGVRRVARPWAPGLGLVLILGSLPWVSVHQHHPGIATLAPVLGTALIIAFAADDWATRLLSLRPITGLGLISYSLYLWHQPVFAFSRLHQAGDVSVGTKLTLMLLAIALATVSWLLVERPTRDRRRVSARAIWWIAGGGLALFGATGAFLAGTHGMPGRLPASAAEIAEGERVEEANIFQNGKGCLNYVAEMGPCIFRGARAHGSDFVLVGDSHANTLSRSFIDKMRAPLTAISSVTLLGRGGCIFLPGLVRVDEGLPSCPEQYNRIRMGYILAHPGSVVVVMMRLPLIIERARFDNGVGGVEPGDPPHIAPASGPYDVTASDATVRNGLAVLVRRMIKGGMKVVLVYPVPEMGWNVPRQLFRLARQNGGAWTSSDAASVPYVRFRNRVRRSHDLLDEVGDSPNLLRIFPERLFCHAQLCVSHDGATVFYRDDNHLNRAGGDRLATEIVDQALRRWAAPQR